MNIEARKSFEKDVLKIVDNKIANSLTKVLDKLENWESLSDINNLKKW